MKISCNAMPFCDCLFPVIVIPLFGGAIMGLFSSHPPVEKRVAKLMAMKGGSTF
jgi:Zn-dependent protease with chaperone function